MSLTSAKKLLLAGKGLFKAAGTWINSADGWTNWGQPFTLSSEGIRTTDNSGLRKATPSSSASRKYKITVQIRSNPGNNASGSFGYSVPGGFSVEFATYAVNVDNGPSPQFQTVEVITPSLSAKDINLDIRANNAATLRNWKIEQVR